MNTWTTCAAEYRHMADLPTYSLLYVSQPSLLPQRLRLTQNYRRQAMYVQRNSEERSCKPLLQRKSNTYYIFWVCVSVASFIQHAMHMSLTCGLSASTLYFHINRRNDFRKKVTEHKMCDLIFSTTFVRNISHSKKKWTRYDKKCT
jgi:hypothetical protein